MASQAYEAPILVKIRYFLVMVVESSSKICHSASISTFGEHAVRYSFEIDDDGVEISLLCHFAAGSPRVPVPMFSGQSGTTRRDLHQSE